MRRMIVVFLACLLSCCALAAFAGCSNSSTSDNGSSDDATESADTSASSDANTGQRGDEGGDDMADGRDDSGHSGGRGGDIDKSGDEDLNQLIDQTEGKFQQADYSDEKTNLSFPYNLFVPEDYDESQSYPLVLFIHDASVVGSDTTAPLEQGYGALVWASKEDQAKHPCFVVAPEYPENILAGENGVTDYVDATMNLLQALQDEYSIDASRLYATGQSMGCMAELYMNATYPDLFAASLYVDGQWDVSILNPLEDQAFFYFAAAGDDKAYGGMTDLMAAFDADGVAYGEATLNAKDSSEDITADIEQVIAEGHRANFITWEAGSVLPDDAQESSYGSEHMYSFDHAYKIGAVRDWLFDQSK